MLPVFVVALFGFAEIASFIIVKQRITKAADEMSSIMSTIPTWQPGVSVVPMLNAVQFAAWPYGVNVVVQFCQRGSGAYTSPAYAGSYAGDGFGAGDCAFRPGGAGGGIAINCGMGSSLSTTAQYVVVGAGCNFNPLLNAFGLFDGVRMNSIAVAPMRYPMPWSPTP